ncbi:hypothetical protein [Sutcliffiella halmapala]|uniref:hypothetical protein n=1 Tax=Sutcliffiella halmapala TaxID=79882 RepID=UPI00099526E7|nr:hypothetical protein [Sutcliffiella halmapala]
MWKSMPFERPTDHYDLKALEVDEKICALLKKRKEVTENNPGFPPLEYISEWSKKYELYENQLTSLFSLIMTEEYHRPIVEPVGFRKILQIFKATELEDRVYYISSIRQYENASVVFLNMEWDEYKEEEYNPIHLELSIEGDEEYYCRMTGGSGSSGHYYYSFIVEPPLPDDMIGKKMIFKGSLLPFEKNQSELELVFEV